MIGTRVDDIDGPRLIRSKFGWWFLGNQTWTLLAPDAVLQTGSLSEETENFLRGTRAFNPITTQAYMLTVLTSTDCNLGCGYCYQNKALDSSGGHRPPRIERNVLGPLAISKILSFTEKKMNEENLKDLFLVLFGGEPLLNATRCLDLLKSARSIGLKTASIVTNGVLLKPKLAVALHANGVRDVQITFDGSRSDHDKIRAFRSGASTYDIILRNVALAMSITQLSWQFRVNVSHHNFERIKYIFREIIDAGVEPSKCTILFAWVGDKGLGYNNSLGFSKTVRDAFVEWSIAALKCGFMVPRPNMKRTCQTCSNAGGRYGAVVNSDGKLYSCWQSAGKSGFEVGDIERGFDALEETRDRWVSCGYEFLQNDRDSSESFHDEVDGRFLDYLHENGLLR
jgi:uncharacterized protein